MKELFKNPIENFKEKTTGVYAIYCSGDDKYYIGSSVDIKKRWIGHSSLLRNKKHYNFYLQNAWNKYGEEAFSCFVVEIFNWKRQDDARRSKQLTALHKREQIYIEKYDATNHKKGFNLTSVTQGGSPRLSTNLLMAGKATISFLQFQQICLLLQYKRWPLTVVAEKLKVEFFIVHRIYKRKMYPDLTKGMVFKSRTLEFKDLMKDVIPKIEIDIKNGLSAPEVIKKYNMPYSPHFVATWFRKNKKLSFDSVRKEIYAFDEYGNFVKKYNQIKDAAKEVGSTIGTLSKACEKNSFHLVSGYVWASDAIPPKMCKEEELAGHYLHYLGTSKSVVGFTEEGIPQVFYYSTSAAEKDGYQPSAISLVCRTLSRNSEQPKIKLYKHQGLIWRFYDELNNEERDRCYYILTAQKS